jgi:hypothetical protein
VISVEDAREYLDRMLAACEPLDGVALTPLPIEDDLRPRGGRGRIGAAFMKASGWRTLGSPLTIKKAVIIGAPHTTNWDLPYTLAIGWHVGLHVKWLGKHTLFDGPFGWAMKSLGGMPVDRRDKNDMVKSIAARFDDFESLLLVVPPEGTRGKTGRWKTGFYWIAYEAKVPIILAFVDYEKKLGGLVAQLMPSGDIEKDFEIIRRLYSCAKGLYPEMQGEITVRKDQP